MTFFRVVLLVHCFASVEASVCLPDTLIHSESRKGYELEYTSIDKSLKDEVIRWVETASDSIVHFAGASFPHSFMVTIFNSRLSLDRQWQADWGMPDFKSECWMVASGTGSRLDLLSPRVWKDEACEHDPTNEIEIERLIAHELMHVFHGQINPDHNFEGMDDVAWLIEGVAVYASGQLDSARMKPVVQSIMDAAYPKTLNQFWTGRNKYGNAGSLVRFIDQKYGRSILIQLLKATSTDSILNVLKIHEDELIAAWANSLN